MLRKNVYILYPAGYYGTYINWAINISDGDLKNTTVTDPINRENSDQRGGPGTSHLHSKVPTHQGFVKHVAWVMYNRPTECKIYNINQGTDTPTPVEKFMAVILNADPDSVFINIHNDLDRDITNFGNINGMIKWPTQMAIRATEGQVSLGQIDPFDCVNDINFRNLVAVDKKLFRHQVPVNHTKLRHLLHQDQQWYDLRHRLQPHEINEETYINPATYIDHDAYQSRVFELSCRDVVSASFPAFLSDFLNKSQACTEFDTTHVAEFHSQFIAAQGNLQWFESIKHWRQTGQVDSFLKSHMGIQGMVIAEMFELCPGMKRMDWHNKNIEELNLIFTNLYNSV